MIGGIRINSIKRDIELFFTAAGEGAPPLVFVHGFAGSHEQWQPQLHHFAAAHRVVSLDLRGHGTSPPGTEGPSIRTLAADVASLLAELDLSGVVLAGHSMGCRVVLETRRQAPRLIAGVILLDGSNIGLGDKEGARRRMDEAIAAHGYESLIRKLFGDMFVEGHDPDLKSRVLTRALALPAEVGRPLLRGLIAYDADEAVGALRKCGLPVLVLQSTTMGADMVRKSLPRGETSLYADLVQAHCPHAEFTVIPGVGHYAQLEAPAAVNTRIEEFLATLKP